MTKKILYYNNCWFTNVGEAFIDIGAMELLRQVSPEVQVANVSNMSHYYIKFNSRKDYNKKDKNAWYFNEFLDGEYLILPGMFACEEFLNSYTSEMISNLSKNGIQIIFLGMGGLTYSNKEIERFQKYLESINFAGIITRDEEAYCHYKNINGRVYSGIDCAFFIQDVYNPIGFSKKEYDIISFNRSKEPEKIDGCMKNVVRPYHFQFSYSGNNVKKNTLISDTPYDYLTLYANAHAVYTDLVHATVVSLMYGVPVRYYDNSKRSLLFKSCHAQLDDMKMLYISQTDLEIEKNRMKQNLQKIIFN